jgi:hypothetical protein
MVTVACFQIIHRVLDVDALGVDVIDEAYALVSETDFRIESKAF